jgi:hypothetical protein
MASSAGSSRSLIQAVLELAADRRTGVLDVRADGVRTRIYFEDGKPRFAEDGTPGETVEQVCGIITRSFRREGSHWDFDASPEAPKPARSFSLEISNPGPDELVVVAAGARALDGTAAEQAFQKGLGLLRAAETAAAAIDLRRAADLRPESPQYLLYATWAEARGRSDIPSEADQQKLRELAQSAKRRDPGFAFASYVIGQLSMWAGDDGTAKKWFYEALRLDPTSEAAAQVRILARRGGTSSGLSGVWKLPDADPVPVESGAVLVSAPPVPPPVPADAIKRIQPPSASAPPNRWAERFVPFAVVIATAGLVTVVAARKSAPKAGMVPSALPQPAPAVSAAPPVALQPQEPPAPADAINGGAIAPEAVKEKTSDDDEKGTVLLPSRASGHRIFVDGRRVETDGAAPLHLLCGPHVIQIGGRGTPEHVDLPCRGEIQLE